ncbi:hypothetical protein Tco_0149498 [Tanacetum coccineum]
MSTQQDRYAAGSKNRPPMLNKDNYVPSSSHLLRYAKSKPNGKLLVNSIKNDLYTDDELTEKEAKQMVADDQAIQTILMGLPKDIYAAVEMVGGNGGNQFRQYVGQNVGNQNGNQNGLIVVPGITNQNGNDNVVAPRAEGNGMGNNGNQQASTSGTQTDKAPVYDSDGSAEDLSMAHSRGTLEQHPATVEETHAYFESLYNNLVTEVEKVNTVNCKMKETNADLTTELARYRGQEKSFEINEAKFDELETDYRKSIYQEQCLTKKDKCSSPKFC